MADILIPYNNRVRFNRENDPAAALEGLRQLSATNPSSAENVSQLESLRTDRLDEMKRNLDLATKYPHQIISGATPTDVNRLTTDLHADPYTGDAAHAQTADTQNRVRGANLEGFSTPQEQAGYGRQAELTKMMMPILTAQAQTQGHLQMAQKFADLQRTLNPPRGGAPVAPGGTTGQPVGSQPTGPAPPQVASPSGPTAKRYLDEQGNPIGGQVGAPTAPGAHPAMSGSYRPAPEFKMGLSASGAPSLSQLPERQLNAQEQGTVDSLRTAHRIMGEVHGLLTQQGVAPTPPDSQMPGFLGQLGSVMKSGATRSLYGLGFPDPTLSGDPQKAELYDKITQLTDLSKVLATRGLLGGMRNYQWIKQIQDHVAQGGQPTTTQLQRIETLLSEYPQMIQDIYDSRAGHTLPTAEVQ